MRYMNTESESAPPLTAGRYQIDDLVIDTWLRQVTRDGADLAISGLSFDLLWALVRVAPHLVALDALREQVWPGQTIGAEIVTQRVKLLRQALGDKGEKPRYILAVRGEGYRMSGAATRAAADFGTILMPVLVPPPVPAGESPLTGERKMAGGMTKQLFTEYIASFNRDDFEGFSKYYADDVVLQLGTRKTLHGRQAIIDFYREVKSKIRETLVIRTVVADEAGLAAEVATEFYALEDWPDFIAGPIRKGESIHIVSWIFYTIVKGRFQNIRSTRLSTGTA
jgi:DNA-binding winged helix-turn-helix (wHTH) protein